jgi:hypothetical protein
MYTKSTLLGDKVYFMRVDSPMEIGTKHWDIQNYIWATCHTAVLQWAGEAMVVGNRMGINFQSGTFMHTHSVTNADGPDAARCIAAATHMPHVTFEEQAFDFSVIHPPNAMVYLKAIDPYYELLFFTTEQHRDKYYYAARRTRQPLSLKATGGPPFAIGVAEFERKVRPYPLEQLWGRIVPATWVHFYPDSPTQRTLNDPWCVSTRPTG